MREDSRKIAVTDSNMREVEARLKEKGIHIDRYTGQIDVSGSFNHIQHPLKRAFLGAIAEMGNVTAAAKLAKIDRTNHPRWMREDPEYAAAYDIAVVEAAENLELEARRRAVQGTARPVFYKGEQCGTIQDYSDTLLIFLLKGALPEKYSEKLQGVIRHEVSVDIQPQEVPERLQTLLDGVIDADYTVLDD